MIFEPQLIKRFVLTAKVGIMTCQEWSSRMRKRETYYPESVANGLSRQSLNVLQDGFRASCEINTVLNVGTIHMQQRPTC